MVGGSGVGVLGWTGWAGLLGFLFAHVMVTLLALVLTQFRPKDYFGMDIGTFAMYGAFGQLMGFVVFWSLAYTLVHVYE